MRSQGTMRRSCLHGRFLGRRAGAEEGGQGPWSPGALEPRKSWKRQGLPEGRPCDQRTCSCTLHLPPQGFRSSYGRSSPSFRPAVMSDLPSI